MYKYGVPEFSSLGQKVDAEGISTASDKAFSIVVAPPPTMKQCLRELLGLLAFYDGFLEQEPPLTGIYTRSCGRKLPELGR